MVLWAQLCVLGMVDMYQTSMMIEFMPYYIRVFCTDNSRPSIDQLLSALNRENPEAYLETSDGRQSNDWREAEYFYSSSKDPVIVEINTNDGPDSLAAEELIEFSDKIGKPGFSISKRRVLGHLAKTRFIVCCQLLNDIDEDGYHRNGRLLNYYVRNHGGLIQADAEGFYDGSKIIVPLD